MADVAQDRADRGGARVDVGVDVQRRHQRHQRRVVDQRDRHPAARLLGPHRHQEVGLVVIGHCQHGIGPVDGGFGQDLDVHAVAVQHDGPLQRVCRKLGPGTAFLDDLGAHPVAARLQHAGNLKPHVARPDDHQPLLLAGALAEDVQRAVHILGMRKHIDPVAREQLVGGVGREQPRVAAHADDDGTQRGEQFRQLPQGGVQHRTIIVQHDAQQLRTPPHETFGIKGGRGRQPLQRRLGHFLLGADDHVDGHVIGAEQVGVLRIQIGLRAQPGDLARHRKHRMRDLAGDHVHLVGIGRGDDHVGIARACAFQHVGVAGKAGDPLHIQRFRRAADQVGIHVDHGHIILFARQVPRDLPADLARAADDDLHRPVPIRQPAAALCIAEPGGAVNRGGPAA